MNKKTHTILAALIVPSILLLAIPANAIGMEDRIKNRQERRGDAVDNTAQGIEDRQDFREQRRDCVGDGANCRQDNRHDKVNDSRNRAQDRKGDRQGRMKKRF